MRNKYTVLIINSLLVIAGIAFLICLIDMIYSFRYRFREMSDPSEEYAAVFEYQLEHKAYNEILDSYHVLRMQDLDPKPGSENIYRAGAYADAAFMVPVYEAEHSDVRSEKNEQKLAVIRNELGDHIQIADDIDKIVGR